MAELFVRGKVRAARGLEATADRLVEEHEIAHTLERRLAAVRRRRALLALKLLTGGISTRGIAALLPGATSAHVMSWKRKAVAERAADQSRETP